MNGISVRDGQNLEKSLGFFSKMIDRSGILSEVKERRHFIKPCIVKKEKLKSAMRKAKLREKFGKEERD